MEYLLTVPSKVVDLQDRSGNSHAHVAVQPLPFGSYENTSLLDALAGAGYSLGLRNAAGQTPADLAATQASGRMWQKLDRLGACGGTQREEPFDGLRSEEFTAPHDFHSDAEQYLAKASKKEEEQIDEAKLRELVPVDKVGGFERSYTVHVEVDGALKKPWDCFLTKVDLKNGPYGCYVFYRMQLLHDTVRELYVVFTRYGRIGEDGMHQRTPFNSLEEAKKEFCTIFKQKTSNNFEELEAFEKAPKKYSISKVNYTQVQHRDYLAPFDYSKAPVSSMEKHSLDLLEEITNFTMY